MTPRPSFKWIKPNHEKLVDDIARIQSLPPEEMWETCVRHLTVVIATFTVFLGPVEARRQIFSYVRASIKNYERRRNKTMP